MARRLPVLDPVQLTYNGPAMWQNARPGPVSGKGYYAEPGQTIEVERIDKEALLETGLWHEPLKSTKETKSQEANE